MKGIARAVPQVAVVGGRVARCFVAGPSQAGSPIVSLLPAPSELSLTHQMGWSTVQRSDFPLTNIQGAWGLALGPCVLFSVWLPAGC